MKKLILIMLAVLMAGTAYAQTIVSGYYRKDGTYVQPHYRSSPNSTQYDNWSTRGNVNPYTGQKGYRMPEVLGQYESPYRRANYGF